MAEAETIFRNTSLQRIFAEQGFVTIPLLNAAEVRKIREQVVALHESRSSLDDGLEPGIDETFLWHGGPAYRQRVEEFARAILAERLHAVVPSHRFLTGAIIVKPAGADALAMHRDWTMTDDPLQTTLNCWCALGDVEPSNGALALLPGSHRILAGNVGGAGIPTFFGAYGEDLKRLSQTIPLAAGEAVVFDYRMLHWSHANRSAEPRPAIAGVFAPAGARPVLHARDPESGRRAIRMIEPQAGAWGDLMVTLAESGPSGLRSAGISRNRNRSMGKAEFERRLQAPNANAALFAALRLKDAARRLLMRARLVR